MVFVLRAPQKKINKIIISHFSIFLSVNQIMICLLIIALINCSTFSFPVIFSLKKARGNVHSRVKSFELRQETETKIN